MKNKESFWLIMLGILLLMILIVKDVKQEVRVEMEKEFAVRLETGK